MTDDHAALIAERVCRDVCELPDRSSPEDQPDMLTVTTDELHMIVTEAIESLIAQNRAKDAEIERLKERLAKVPETLEERAFRIMGDPSKGVIIALNNATVKDA